MKIFLYNIPSLAFLAAGLYLFHEGSTQWGWLVFIAFLLAITPKERTETQSEKKEEKSLDEEIRSRLTDEQS
jgi:hypothetical protein